MEYIYHGDKLTDLKYKKQPCKAVRTPNGKCIRGRNSNMLVEFENGDTVVILARMLRKIKPHEVAEPKNSFQKWMEGLWEEETLEQQRERMVKEILSPKKLEERERLKKKKEPEQLTLF